MADGIPYPQAPTYGVANPLQQAGQFQALGLRGAEMQRVQQTVEQQELVNRSKRAIGALAQESLDPQTKELDMHKLLSLAAQHPEASLGYTDLAKQALEMGILDADRHQKQLAIQAQELDMTSRAMAPLLDDPDVQNNTPSARGKIGAAFAQIGMAAGKPRDWATQRFLEYNNLQNKGSVKSSDFVRNAVMGSQQGLSALETARKNFNELTAPVSVSEYDPNTGEYVQTSIPKSEWMKRQAGRGNLVGVGSAPPGAASRQMESPSAPSATSYDKRSIMTQPPLGEAEYQKELMGQWAGNREKIAVDADTATRDMIDIESQVDHLKTIGERTGLFAPETMNLAKAAMFLGSPGAAEMLMATKNQEDVKKILAAEETFDKTAIRQRANALRASLPNDRHSTKEFDTFNAAVANLRTTPDGIMDIYKYMEKLNNLAIRKAQFLEQYEKIWEGTPKARNLVDFNIAWAKRVGEHRDWTSFEDSKGEKK